MAQASGEVGKTRYVDPDGISWRLNTLVWAGQRALRIPGDFVECGVYKGDMAWVVTEMIDLSAASRLFFLFDTFGGFDPRSSSEDDFSEDPEFSKRAHEQYAQSGLYETVRARFAAKAPVRVIQGSVPEVLEEHAPATIAFLHLDMNSPAPEVGALELLFDRVSPGGVIVFDDYGWKLHHKQKEAADAFAAARGYEIMELATGQGLLVKY